MTEFLEAFKKQIYGAEIQKCYESTVNPRYLEPVGGPELVPVIV